MEMTDLASHGYPVELIEIWEQQESKELLPIQEKAIQECDILNTTSKNILIIAPTSSGKTFVGELVAVKEALEMRRSLFLVPFRAIAEEHYANFQAKYKDYGFRVVISDRDHREYDDDIIGGEYEIAIVVYEKLVGLLVQNPELLSRCGLVVADEVQMMMDKDRGPTVELLLTRLLLSKERLRILALSAVLDKLNGFDKWLNAQVLRAEHRPVELREGVYRSNGQVDYREFNSKKNGIEKLSPWSDIEEGLINLVQTCIDRAEQVLVFCHTRRSSVNTAHMLARELTNMSPAIDTISAGNELAESSTREEIQNLLQLGVCYHNSDLNLEERLLIEEGFRKNEIKVLACTSTLAMGVNVPASDVVVFPPTKWDGRYFVPIAVSEYKNTIGRAGRYSFGDPYGRSYLLAENQAKADMYTSTYILGTLEGFSSSFGEETIDSQVLDVIAGGLATTKSEVHRFIFSTYNGQHKWTTDTSKDAIRNMISESIKRCLEYEAVELDESGSLNSTPSGSLCAAGGYTLDHLEHATHYLKTYKKDVDLSVLFNVLEMDAAAGTMAYHIPRLRGFEYNSGMYQQALAQIAANEDVGPLLDYLASRPNEIAYEQCVTLRRSLACYAWISSIPIRRIEANFPGITIGSIRNTAQVCAWLISFLEDLARTVEPNSERNAVFGELAERLSHGATKESLALCRIRRSGLSRDERNHLVSQGIKTIDDILERKPEEIPLSHRKASRLIGACEETIEDSIERRKRLQQSRLRSLGLDTSILAKLYERTGKQLEILVDDLLKKPFVTLTCRRVTVQKEGDPDHLLYDSEERVFAIQTTAREKKNVAMRKATSVIGQSSKYQPSGYIVIGRPDFEALAIKDADSQVAAGRNYKLIPVFVLAEAYVLVHEGKLASADVEKVLIEWKGYINLKRLYTYIGSIDRAGLK